MNRVLKPVLCASILTAFLCPIRFASAEDRPPPREKLRVEWAPMLSQFGYVIVKGDEALPLTPSMSRRGPVDLLFEGCRSCQEKIESGRKKMGTSSILAGVGIGSVIGGLVLFSAHHKLGNFLPWGVMIGGFAVMGAGGQQAISSQQDFFDAVRLYNEQTP